MENNLKELIIEQLREVYDPEIPINVYDLGLIYEINVKENNDVHVVMSLTSPTCPTADYLKMMIEEAVKGTSGVNEVEIELTFDPKWTPDRVAQEAKEELGLVASPQEDLAIQNVFQGDLTGESSGSKGIIKESICFNCAVNDTIRPVIACKFKGEDTFICTKCMSKF